MSKIKKSKNGRFIGIPHHIASSHYFISLSAKAVKLLIDLLHQYNGSNNGTISISHSVLKDRNWGKSCLYRAFRELNHSGFIVVTRQGRKVRGCSTFVAITWNGIDFSDKVQYDPKIKVSKTPLGYWKKDKSTWDIFPNIKEK